MYYLCTMKGEYNLDFVSSSGKLKCRMFYDNRIAKCKTFQIRVTPDDVRHPSPTLERMMLNIKSEFNQHMIELYGTGKSPIKLMFASKNAETRTPMEFFKMIHDYRLKRWVEFIDKDIEWKDIDDELLTDYHSFLEAEDIAINTIRAYMFGLKKCLDDAKVRGYKIKSTMYASILKAPISQAISIYLTREELKLLEDVKLEKKWDEVRTKFLIGAYTGARYSDFSKITAANIGSGEVQFISQKTRQLSYVPLHEALPDLLKHYNSDVSNALMNRVLPKIGEMAGINSIVTVVRGDKRIEKEKWNFLKSHTARRTFATGVYLSGEYDMRSISKFLGHKSVTTTESYIQCGVYPANREKWSYFTKL